jgi:hypothetical protein
MNKFRVAQFDCQQWHPLTDLPVIKNPPTPAPPADSAVAAKEKHPDHSVAIPQSTRSNSDEAPDSLSNNAKMLQYNTLLKLHLCSSERMQDLDLSGRAYEAAKQELITRGLIMESNAGKKKFLIPMPEAFTQFNVVCPYKNTEFVEHSFYLYLVGYSLKRKASSKSVSFEYKLADSGNTADIAVQREDGILYAYEITASTGNIVQNCLKYEQTGFKQISFVCRNCDILKAVKSKVLNAGLPLLLLNKLDFVLLSSILKEERD